MNVAGLIFLIITQVLCGRAVIGIFNIRLKPLALFCLSMIIGTILISPLPVLLEVFHIPITGISVLSSILALTLLLNITQFQKYDWFIFRRLQLKMPRLYELIFILTFIGLMLPAIWRSFYYPPYARDILSGPEALAEYAVREKTIINSVFRVDLASTNNHLKPPLVLGLQIIYKLLVNPFGQTWLIMMSLCFLAWLYGIIREKLHPLVTGVIMLMFITMPDPYGYTYLLLFDYCNMMLFFAGFYFLAQYAQNRVYSYFFFSAFLFALATYIRLETVVLIAMAVPLILWLFRKNNVEISKMAIGIVILLGASYLVYFLWIDGFIKHYMPVGFDIGNQVNTSFNNFSIFFEKLELINSKLLFGGLMIYVYGYFVYFFCAILAADIIFFRRSFNLEAAIALYAIAIVYIGMPLLGYLIPWFDVGNTTKRGLFKLFPLMVLYMRNSGSLLKLSVMLLKYEGANGNRPLEKAAAMRQKSKATKK